MQEMKLGTSASSVSCSYPKDTHTGRSILSYRQPVIQTSLWEDVGGRISDLCVLHAPEVWDAQCSRSVPLVSSCHCFLSLPPLLYFFRIYFSNIPLVTDIFCCFSTMLNIINCTLSQLLVNQGSERPLCKVMEKAL